MVNNCILSKRHPFECNVLSTSRLSQDSVRGTSVEQGLNNSYSANYFHLLPTTYQLSIGTRQAMWLPQVFSLPSHRLQNESLLA